MQVRPSSLHPPPLLPTVGYPTPYPPYSGVLMRQNQQQETESGFTILWFSSFYSLLLPAVGYPTPTLRNPEQVLMRRKPATGDRSRIYYIAIFLPFLETEAGFIILWFSSLQSPF